MLEEFYDFKMVSFEESCFRIALACILGMAIGLDRDMKKKPIDFRAYMIVAATACLVAIMAQEVYAEYQSDNSSVRLDFMRIIEGVLTGIGFLGAGAIIRAENSNRVIGTATGASIWASGGLGLALGFGFYGLTAIAFVAIVTILFIIGMLMPYVSNRQEEDSNENESR